MSRSHSPKKSICELLGAGTARWVACSQHRAQKDTSCEASVVDLSHLQASVAHQSQGVKNGVGKKKKKKHCEFLVLSNLTPNKMQKFVRFLILLYWNECSKEVLDKT